MKKQYSFIFSLLAFFLISQLPINQVIAQKKGKTIKSTTFSNLSSKKMTVVFIHAPWDGWSRRMENMTWSDPAIVKYVNKNFNFINLNAEDKKSITHNGKTYNFDESCGKNGCHELAKELAGGDLKGYPTIAILDEDGNLVQAIPGYITTKDMEVIMKYFGEEIYKEKTWDEFVKEYSVKLEEKSDSIDGSEANN